MVQSMTDAGAAESVRLADLSDDFLREAGVPEACFPCSTARSRAFRGNFVRPCPGPTDTVKTVGKVITGQLFCRYPTGPEK